MPYIDISIREKIATKTDDVGYVCGNSDYMIRFDFDAEWEAHRYRTARFIFNGKFIEMVFEGNECPVPIIENTYCFEVGVYAGDLHTTTPAYVPCKKSILCGGAIPDTVRPEAYYAADALEGKQDKLATYIELRERSTVRVKFIGAKAGQHLHVLRKASKQGARFKRWSLSCKWGYAQIAECILKNAGGTEIEYCSVPSWMPNDGYLADDWTLTDEDIARGYIEIDITKWLLPLMKPVSKVDNFVSFDTAGALAAGEMMGVGEAKACHHVKFVLLEGKNIVGECRNELAFGLKRSNSRAKFVVENQKESDALCIERSTMHVTVH